MPHDPRLAIRYVCLLMYRAVVKRIPSLMFAVVVLALFALAFSRLDAIRSECNNPHLQYAMMHSE